MFSVGVIIWVPADEDKPDLYRVNLGGIAIGPPIVRAKADEIAAWLTAAAKDLVALVRRLP